MRRSSLIIGLGLVLGLSAFSQEPGKGGLNKGSLLPGPFEALNINGPAKGRPHCLICANGQRPAVMAFVREPAEGKDAGLNELLAKLETLTSEAVDSQLAASVIVLTPDLAAAPVGDADGEKLNAEFKKKEALVQRLLPRAEKLKNVVLACMPAGGPAKYALDGKAEATLVYYSRLRVVEVATIADGEFNEAAVASFLSKVRAGLKNAQD